MCELMGLCFAQPVSADFSIRPFSCGDIENADGWGLAWYPDRSLALVKEARTWRQSGYSTFLESYQGLQSRIYMAHLRHMTVGGTATHANTHPFSREYAGCEYCFAHNGTVREATSLPLGRFQPIGTTDSEHVFCHLLEDLASRGESLNSETTWRRLHQAFSKLNEHGTLNCLLSDGERLIAYRDVHGWKGMALRRVHFHEQGARLFEDSTMEITMDSETHNRGYVVATRPLSTTGWHVITPGNLVVLQEGALLYSSVEI